MSNDFEKDLAIDPAKLDVEAGLQGELFFKWAEKAVEARKDADYAKFHLEVTVTDTSIKARRDPGSFGLSKATEGAIDTAVKASIEYREAYDEWIEKKAASALLDKAVEAMEQRKRMIEILVTLHGQQYFAGPSVPRNLVEAWNEVKGGRDEEVKKKTRRRKKGGTSNG